MIKNISFAILATVLLATTGCKKDSVDPPGTPETTEVAVDATVGMRFSFVDGTAPFMLDSTVLQDSLGHNVKLEQVRFFVNSIHAFDDEGDTLAHYQGKYLLVDAAHADTTFAIGAIHASHIHEFPVDLGLDAGANSLDPSVAPVPMNDTSMYFNSTMGYKFLVATGHADINGDGNFGTPVNYACGMDMLLTPAHAHVHHDLAEGEMFNAQVLVDMGLLFKGIDLSVDNMPMMDAAPSMRMMRNLSTGIDGAE